MYYSNTIDITIFITFFTIILLYRDRILVIIQQLPDYIENFSKENSIHKYLNEIDFNINKLNNVNNVNNVNAKSCNLNFDTIEFKNVVFKYKNSKKIIFDNLNINLNLNNKIIGITGLSGNGKSTFVKLIIKMFDYKGDILIDNINIKNIDNTCVRKNIVYVNQTSKLFNKNIDYNIYYGIKNKELVSHYINEIYQFEKIKQLFSNIDMDKNVGTNGENLSGGQRQIINIINGLIIPSKILILDEPTNALDPLLKKDVISLIKYFKKYKKCIIIISHDKDIYSIFNETINI
jgi:ABC-type multidrug transport system fused ATPase/permease subunit